MNEEQRKLISKAERSLKAARSLYENRDYDFSVSRAYYAMFYCAECLLLTLGMSFSKHSAIISAFGKYFAKTGILPSTLHSYLISAYKDRQIGDYEVIKKITKVDAEINLKNAEEFLYQTIKYFEEKGGSIK